MLATGLRPPRSDDATVPDWQSMVDELELLRDSDARACATRSLDYLELAAAHEDEDAEMRLSYYAAFAYHLLGEDAPALAAAARTELLASERGELVWQSRALVCRGLVHHVLGDLEDAVDLLTRALDLRRQAHDDAGTASVLNSLGAVYTGMAHFAPQAAHSLNEARRLWLAVGDPDHASMALTNLATTYVRTSSRLLATNPRGAQAAARHALGIALQAVQDSDAAGLSRTGVDARLAVIGAHMVTGDLERAGLALEATRSMLTRFPMPSQELAYRIVQCRWLVRSGLLDDAVTELGDALDLCDELDRPGERIELLVTLVDAHDQGHDPEAALRTLREVYRLTVGQSEALAERRAMLLGSRLDIERAQRLAEAESRRALELEERNARLEHEATHDALTGLPNRRALDTTVAHWAASHTRDFGCALLDIDHFKRVNDRWSHQAGDRVLERLGTVLSETVRASDFAARYGGEEFALLLDGVDEVTGIEACERVRAAVEARVWEDLIPGGRITISLGLSMHSPGAVIGTTLERADAALYASKNAGRNQVRLAT